MASHVALMRGINVGGRNKLPMADLAQLFEQAGGRSVRTYIQSGNVVFEASEKSSRAIVDDVRRGLREQRDLDVPIVLRTADEFRAVMTRNPFLGGDVDPKHLGVGFLLDAPAAEAIATLDPDRSDVDSFEVHGREIYFHIPGGMARTKLTTAYFDSRLDTVVTVRNWRTVTRLAEMLG